MFWAAPCAWHDALCIQHPGSAQQTALVSVLLGTSDEEGVAVCCTPKVPPLSQACPMPPFILMPPLQVRKLRPMVNKWPVAAWTGRAAEAGPVAPDSGATCATRPWHQVLSSQQLSEMVVQTVSSRCLKRLGEVPKVTQGCRGQCRVLVLTFPLLGFHARPSATWMTNSQDSLYPSGS